MTSIATSTTTLATTATSTRATTVSHSRTPRSARPEWGARAVVLALGSTAFLFAGSYTIALIPAALLCLMLAIAYPPRLATTVDWCLAVIGLCLLAQLILLPREVIDIISPHARDVWRALTLDSDARLLPISVNRAATVRALAVYACAALLFVTCCRMFSGGGLRVIARGVATTGLLLAAICLAQDATGHGLMYWRWPPPFAVAAPFGPFINRNHFATWVVMAVPVSLGYLLAHGAVHGRNGRTAQRHAGLLQLADARSIWLTAAICLMLVGLVVSRSRAGLGGMTAAIIAVACLRARRTAPLSRWAVAALGLGALIAAVFIDAGELYQRFRAVDVAAADRMAIWRATLPVIRDFWLTGSGAGTFETVMLAYQRVPSLFRINSAHSQYLQAAAEGGIVVSGALIVALAGFARLAWRALAAEVSPMSSLRIGALAGLIGVAVQSVWETGLSTPANALLAAVLAAMVVHSAVPAARPTD